MNYGIAMSGVCGIAAIGALKALCELGLKPHGLFLEDNSILPAYLYIMGEDSEEIIAACEQVRGQAYRRKKAHAWLCEALTGKSTECRVYLSAQGEAFTNQPSCFPKADRDTGKVFTSAVIQSYLSSEPPKGNPPQTWPLTCMGCDRIFLVSPYCCNMEGKSNFHLRLPSYDLGAMRDLHVSFFQGYRAVMHMEKKIYEALLF